MFRAALEKQIAGAYRAGAFAALDRADRHAWNARSLTLYLVVLAIVAMPAVAMITRIEPPVYDSYIAPVTGIACTVVNYWFGALGRAESLRERLRHPSPDRRRRGGRGEYAGPAVLRSEVGFALARTQCCTPPSASQDRSPGFWVTSTRQAPSSSSRPCSRCAPRIEIAECAVSTSTTASRRSADDLLSSALSVAAAPEVGAR